MAVPRPLLGAALALGTLLTACAGPGGLAPGVPANELTRRLGPPSAEYTLAPEAGSPATRRLEYTGGTFGKTTHMLDLDASGRLVANTQVRSEPYFNRVQPGMTEAEVLRTIGMPSERFFIRFQSMMLWSYRYDTPICQWFQVGLREGRVAEASFGPDPMCFNDNAS
jgi:hypothetical protein